MENPYHTTTKELIRGLLQEENPTVKNSLRRIITTKMVRKACGRELNAGHNSTVYVHQSMWTHPNSVEDL